MDADRALTLRARRRGRFFRAQAFLACGALFTLSVTDAAGGAPAEVGIRSAVTESHARSSDPAGFTHGPEAGPIYFIATSQQISGDTLLRPPVNVDTLLRQVRHALNSRGYRSMEKGQRPDLVFTVEYGRDWLDNPFLEGTRDLPPRVGASSATPVNGTGGGLEHLPHHDLTGAPTHLMSQLEVGREAKIQKALSEKLFIRLNAWQFQADAKAQPKLLWVTTMVVDDPEHVDLNAVSTSMLAAGAPFFGREIRDGEVSVPTPVPEGHVKLGATRVVDAVVATPVPAAATPDKPLPPAEDTRRQFDLPAGDAASALQAFSRQSGLEIIYPVEQVRVVRTKRVTGKLDPRTALDRLLEGTGLVAVQDETTGAIAVHRAATR
jgi:hypothetical protein